MSQALIVIGAAVISGCSTVVFMLVWHRHTYAETDRVYATGNAQNFEAKRSTPEVIAMGMALTMGQTTIVSRCEKCGKTSTTTVIGDARTTPPPANPKGAT